MDIYQQRRNSFLSQLDEDSAVILVGNTQKVRNKNISYPFRQDHDFYYLTGFAQPDALVVLRPGAKHPYIMFNQPSDPHQEVWFATRAGQQGAVSDYGADLAFDIAELEQKLPELLGKRKHLYLCDELGRFSHRIISWLNSQRQSAKFDERKVFRVLHSGLPELQNKRRVKSPHEINLIKKAVNASVEGHKHIMSMCQPGMTEQQVTAEFFNKVASFGCSDVGYPTIAAAANNACCLHYSENRDTMKAGDLMLLDAGGDYQYYTADITRTFPINGRFSPEQKDVYQLVLNALDEAIETVKPGASWNSMYPRAMEVLAQGLIDLKILKCGFDEAMETKAYEAYTLHKTGHWLGMDVHDVGAYHDQSGAWVKLEPNMVFTIEPGLYFPSSCEKVDARWRGMGVRIEDDILVTQTGSQNLSEKAPRTIEEIETLMNSQ